VAQDLEVIGDRRLAEFQWARLGAVVTACIAAPARCLGPYSRHSSDRDVAVRCGDQFDRLAGRTKDMAADDRSFFDPDTPKYCKARGQELLRRLREGDISEEELGREVDKL